MDLKKTLDYPRVHNLANKGSSLNVIVGLHSLLKENCFSKNTPKKKTQGRIFNLISLLFCRYEKGDSTEIIESGLITFCGQKDACLDRYKTPPIR